MTPAQIIRVVLWMTGTLLSFSAMAVSVRAMAGSFSIAEILSVRSGAGLLIVLAIGIARPQLLATLTTQRLSLHLVRNASHLTGQFLWSTGVVLLPLATVFALEFTMPAWTTLLAVLLLGESLNRGRIAALLCGFFGVLVILRPGLDAFQPAALLVLAAAFGYAAANIATKKLTATQSTFNIVFWMNAMQFPVACALGDPLFFLRIDGANVLGVLGVGIAGLTAHYCLTNALAAGDASVVVPLDFMRLPLIALVGWSVYGESLDLYVFAGAGLIIAGVLWNLHGETRNFARTAPARVPLDLRES